MTDMHIYVTVAESCPACEGTGTIYAPRCSQCGEPITQAQWDAVLNQMRDREASGDESPVLLACGHPMIFAQDEWECQVCGGTGVRERRIPVTKDPEDLISVAIVMERGQGA